VINRNSCDWFKFIVSFGLFVNSAESVNKHFDYFYDYFCYALQLYECIIAAATASLSLFSAMSVFGVENRCRFLRSKTGAGFRPRVSSALGDVLRYSRLFVINSHITVV